MEDQVQQAGRHLMGKGEAQTVKVNTISSFW